MAQIKLTKGQIKKYEKSGGQKCPVCKSEKLSAETPDIDGTSGDSNVTCPDCGATWKDIWRFAGIDEDSVDDGK